MIKWGAIIWILLMFGFGTLSAQCDAYILRGTSIFDGEQTLVQPGQTICLEGGSRDYLVLKNIHGTPSNPILIKNENSAVIIETGHYYGIKISNCSFIRFSGTGNPQITFGVQILRVDQGAGISVTDLSTDVEIDHVEVANIPIGGIYAKSEPDCNFNSTRDKFTMYNFLLHDCYLHDIADEGLYIGSSKYSGQTITCDGKDTTVLPHIMVGTRIYNNIVENTGWDGIQVSSSESDCEIHDNIVREDSQEEYQYQMSGIIIGGGSQCDCYNNQIFDGKGDGIDILGLGNMKIYNNLIVNAGRTYKPNDPNAFKHGIFVGESVTLANATYDIFNNTIVNPKSNGIKFANQEIAHANFINNLITNPGRLAVEGNQAYINGVQSSINKVTNIFSPDNSSVLFLGQNPYQYDLKPNSPAVNTGTNMNGYGLSFDAVNRNRPFHTFFDIGAFECHDPQADITQNRGESELTIFPNPSSETIQVVATFLKNITADINIFDLTGKQLAHYRNLSFSETGGTTIHVDWLTPGTYILKIEAPEGTISKNFLIN